MANGESRNRRLGNIAWRASHAATAAVLTMVAVPAAAQDAEPEELAQVEEAQSETPIIVTGSRIARTGFTAPTPVTQIGSDRLENLGVSNVGEALEDLPSFRAASSPQTAGVTIGAGGARTVDLRGLGAPRSLVLVNGRRFVPSTAEGTVDTNLIPSLLIDRVELVTGGASAAYGSDAVAGVVNFILDNDFEGVRGNVQLGISERGEDQDYFASLAVGTSFADDRGHLLIGGEYHDNEGLGGCYEYFLCAQEWQVLSNSTPGVNGYPAFYLTDDVHTALLTQGGRIIGAPPLGTIQFDAEGNPVPFELGILPGLFMGGGSGDYQNPFRSAGLVKVPVERYSLYGRAEYEFDALTVFAEGSFGSVDVFTEGAQPRDFGANFLRISQDNPYIPAEIRPLLTPGAPLVIGRAGDDFGPALGYTTTETLRATGGVEGEFAGGAWTWDAYYQYGQTDYSQIVRNNRITANWLRAIDAVVDPASGDIVCRATLSPDPDVRAAAAGCEPINIFGQYQWSQAGKDYAFGTGRQETQLRQHVVAANVQGSLFETWAGPVSLAAGLEYRSDKISGTTDPISAANGFYVANGQSFDAPAVEVREGYLETVVPLADGTPGAYLLELNGAVRLTDYSTSGSVTTWKAGAVYEPVEGVRLRGTLSRDIRAPNVNELFSPVTTGFASILDRATGINSLTQIFSGGNPDLDPEKADTWTVGVVLQPAFLPGLRFSADYYDIEIQDAIGVIGAQTIANRCYEGAQEYCALLTRGADGSIVAARDQYQNINQIITRGIDFELDYTTYVGEGSLSLRALATYVDDLITIDSVGSTDRAGMTGIPVSQSPGIPDWVLDATINYEQDWFGMTLQAHYIAEGKYDVTLIGPDDPGYDISLPNSINDNTVSDFLTFTLSTRFTVADVMGGEVQFYTVIDNLFDADPPLAPGSTGYTNGVLFDQVGRRYRAGFRFNF